ncbi:MAG TPA: ParM/StbA family protein, partial [Clostridia bacterium]|nr:ParM/StbA family protein [Clostridia bacterium]
KKVFTENQEVLLATATAIMLQNNKRKEKVHLVTGLPLDYYMPQREEYKKQLRQYRASVTVNGYCDPIEIMFDEVTVFPQGAGAIYYSLLKDENKYLVPNSYIALVDVGHKTTDIVVFYIESNGKLSFAPEMSGTVNTGTKYISVAIEEAFMAKYGSKISTRNLLLLINSGEIFYDNKVDREFQPRIMSLKESMSQVLRSWMTRTWGSDGLKEFSHIVFSGGGGKDIYNYFHDVGPVISLADDPQFANAHGFLSVGQG